VIKKQLPNKIIIAHLCLLGAGIIWAAAGPLIKITLGYIPPATFLFLRFLIVAIVLLPYTVFELLKTKIDPKDYLNLFILGVLSQTAILIIFISHKYADVLDITIIGVMGAVLSVYLGHYFYKDKIDSKLTFGLILASIGTLIIVIEPLLINGANMADLKEKLLGNFLAIVYNIAWIAFLLFSKMCMGEKSEELKKDLKFLHIRPMTKAYSSTLITSLSFYVGLITILPFMLWEYFSTGSTFDIFSIGSVGLFGLLYMAILSSIVAYMLYEYGLEYAKVSDTAIYGYLQPILTLPFAYYLVGETPNEYMLLGGLIITIGVVIAEARKS